MKYFSSAMPICSLISRKKKGGGWQREVHDYHSLPLMLRENTILPMGNNEVATVYDYSEGVTFVLSEFTEGGAATAEIPDIHGNIVMRVQAKYEGDEIIVEVEGEGHYNIRNLGSGSVKLV